MLTTGCLLDVYPKIIHFQLFLSNFGHFWAIHGVPAGQLGAPFIFKDGISTYNHSFFALNPEKFDVCRMYIVKINYFGRFNPILGIFWIYMGPLQAT